MEWSIFDIACQNEDRQCCLFSKYLPNTVNKSSYIIVCLYRITIIFVFIIIKVLAKYMITVCCKLYYYRTNERLFEMQCATTVLGNKVSKNACMRHCERQLWVCVSVGACICICMRAMAEWCHESEVQQLEQSFRE